MKVKLDGAFVPERAHATDAGLDLRTPVDAVVPARGSVVIDTGVHVQLPHGTRGDIVSKSGLNVKHDIISTGLIDEGYTGSIMVKLYNLGDTDYAFKAGDKISQLVVSECLYPLVNVVTEINGGERGNGGFGSTGR